LGLSQPANATSLSNEIYGVVPYIAPEIFQGSKFSKESDIYSLGMIMWELTTGCKPFANIEHDHNLIYEIIDGKRPEITYDTPEFFANLMKRCWNSDPSKRPTTKEICELIIQWNFFIELLRSKQFDPEQRRMELIRSKRFGPKFSEPHQKAIFISRALSSMISEFSSINLPNTEQSMY